MNTIQAELKTTALPIQGVQTAHLISQHMVSMPIFYSICVCREIIILYTDDHLVRKLELYFAVYLFSIKDLTLLVLCFFKWKIKKIE